MHELLVLFRSVRYAGEMSPTGRGLKYRLGVFTLQGFFFFSGFPFFSFFSSSSHNTMSERKEKVSVLSTPIQGTKEQVQLLEELKSQFTITTDMLKQVATELRARMDEGLTTTGSCVPMLPSWITHHPTGQETGEYLGLELTGSVIRIYLVTFQGRGRVSTRQQKHTLSEAMKTSNINDLLDRLAEMVDQFLSFVGKSDVAVPLSLGFVLSFPLNQSSINKASVAQWTKDFDISGYKNKNIVELLQAAFHRRDIPVRVVAILNSASMY
jgi:hexokinase